VVDASVAFGWFATVDGSERAVALLDAQPGVALIAPDLVLVDAITPEQFQAIGELAPLLFHDLVPAATLLNPAQRWCQELDHPAYDCLYLALAERRSAVVLTQDQRLLRKLQAVPKASGLVMALDALELAG
jgi:predicted nucleic acid-binding protein